MKNISLSSIVEWLALATDGWKAYLSVDDARIMTVTLDQLAIGSGLVRMDGSLQEGEELDPEAYLSDEYLEIFDDEEREAIRRAQKMFFDGDGYRELPGNQDFSMLTIMNSFALAYSDQSVRDTLLSALSRSDAAQQFLRSLQGLCIEHEWCEARDAALRVIARDWCIENHVLFED